MEEIDPVKNIAKIQGIKKIPPLDHICLSNEAEKVEIYVEMLKKMPEIRDELVVAPRAIPDPKKIAEAMLS